jgi:hypothetical protein
VTRAKAALLALCALCSYGAGLSGCDAQVDRAYPGEPLAVLHGVVRGSGSGPLPPLESALLWQRGAPPAVDDLELATRAPVESGFPATFTLRLYQPPPAAARRTLAPGEVAWARASPAAVPYGIAASAVAGLPASANPGYVVDAAHWVVHLAGDVPPASLTAWWLGGALPAGYHLLSQTPLAESCVSGRPLEACVVDLVLRGLRDDGTRAPGTARGFCAAPYRLAPAPPNDPIVLDLSPLGGVGDGQQECP